MRGMGKPRTFTTWYEDALGAEHDLSVEVEADGRFDIRLCTDLPEMDGDQEQRIKERVAELYWAAEREEYLSSGEAERNGE